MSPQTMDATAHHYTSVTLCLDRHNILIDSYICTKLTDSPEGGGLGGGGSGRRGKGNLFLASTAPLSCGEVLRRK